MTTTTLARSDGPTQFDAAAWLEEHSAGDILMTPDGWMTEANRPARRIFRLPGGQDVRGLSFRRFCRQPARFAETVQAIRTAGYVGSWDADLVAFDGRPVHAVVNLVGDFEAGFLTAIRAQIFDISDWRRNQERTLFGQRIEAIGRLAGGVAHDFNNLLTVISGHAECLSVALAPDSPMNRSVVAIQASAARAATLTEKLLSFGRRQVLQPQVIDLADLTRRVEATLRRAVGHRLSLSTQVAHPTWRVRVDPGRTERALSAIASHAIEAMADGGALAFCLGNADIGPEWSPTRAFVKPGRFVRLDMTCIGMTLDADTHVRMFEPFFSEKGAVRDGMGLAAAFGLVKQSGGYMWLEAERPGETLFTVLLPAVAGEADAPGREPADASPATILVVDDDDAVRNVIVKIIAQQGYKVLAAASADAALRLGQDTPVDLLIADVLLDGARSNVLLDGARSDDLAAALLRDWPRMRLLGISGHPADGWEPGSPEQARVAFLQKPFTAAALIERVRRLLEV
jgi:two-component system, cell cycle sensor histidine kinase and response regulator CckA